MAAYREVSGTVKVLRACWRVFARVGIRKQFSARFSARCGSLPMENLDAEAFRFGGEGRNRTMRGPNSIQKCHILQASQALGGHYFSLGFHPFYTQFYTQMDRHF